MIAATILAAGESSRMGSPKALLRYRGRTFLETILEIMQEIGVHRCIAVGRNAHTMLAKLDLSGVTVVTNRELEAGPIGSIRASIRAIRSRSYEGLLVWPIDFPHVAAGTALALVERFQRSDRPKIVVPSFREKRGHPVLFSKAVFDELLAAPNRVGARAVVNVDPARVAQVPVNDRAVVDEINTPVEYADLLKRTGEPSDRA